MSLSNAFVFSLIFGFYICFLKTHKKKKWNINCSSPLRGNKKYNEVVLIALIYRFSN